MTAKEKKWTQGNWKHNGEKEHTSYHFKHASFICFHFTELVIAGSFNHLEKVEGYTFLWQTEINNRNEGQLKKFNNKFPCILLFWHDMSRVQQFQLMHTSKSPKQLPSSTSPKLSALYIFNTSFFVIPP